MKTLVDYNDRNNATLSNEEILQAVSKFMSETEEEESDTKHNAKNVTMDTFNNSPVTTNTQRESANMKNERRIYLYILEETIEASNGLTIKSTINDYAYYNSEEDETESNLNRRSKGSYSH